MLSEQELDRVCVVLVRARNPSNIGAVARAMHDFGFRRLRVVNEFRVPFEAAKSAVDASAVLAEAMSYASVAEAVGDCTLVVGTTAVGERDLQHPLVTLAEAGARVRAELRKNPRADGMIDPDHDDEAVMNAAPRVAVLFGSEKTGLSDEELSHCNWLLTIPMQEHEGVRHPSMNLGQAVAVCLYELVRDDAVSEVTAEEPATAASLERLTALLSDVVTETEYTRRHPGNSNPTQVRRLVRRMGVDAVDAPIWMGILRQVLWKVRGGRD